MSKSERCPVCGTDVEKESHFFSKAGGTATGAAIGSIVPGIGTLIGAGVGYLGSKFIADDDFTCPTCGYQWNIGDYHDPEVIKGMKENYYGKETELEDDEEGYEFFKEKWSFFLENEDDIISSEKSLLDYIQAVTPNSSDDWVNALLLYTRAVACMDFIRLKDRENNIVIKKGCEDIDRAVALSDGYDEFKAVQCFFKYRSLDTDAPSALSSFKKIEHSAPYIDDITDSLLAAEFLKECYNDAKEDAIFDILCQNLESGNQDNVRNCARIMESIGTTFSTIVSNKALSDFYTDDQNENLELAFKYAKKVIDKTPGFEYSDDVPFHKYWLGAMERVAYCYCEGLGTAPDNTAAYEYAQKASDLGSDVGCFVLGLIYKNGRGVPVDKRKALDFFRLAQERGFDAKKEIAELEKELGVVVKPSVVSKQTDFDIFISYSRRDTDVVSEFVSKLEENGYRVWIDRDGIESGDAFKSVIVDAIDSCQVVLFFSSASSNSSQWTAKEIGVAVDSKKSIIPIKLDDSRYDKSVRLDLINLDYIDFTDLDKRDAFMEKLLRSLESKVVRMPSATEPSAEGSGELTEDENEYLMAYTEALGEESVLSAVSERMLSRLQSALGISDERVAQIRAMATSNQLTDEEKEYLDAYKDALEDGVVSAAALKMLNRYAVTLGISPERAAELQKMA